MASLPATEVINAVLDEASFASWDEAVSQPALGPEYTAALQRATDRTGLDEAIITGEGRLDGRRVALAAGEFGFLAGSVGAAASERLTRAVERATAEQLPLLVSPCSGGTRMQEGTPAFIHMVKIGQVVTAHKRAGLAYLVYLRHPTTGGVLASWGSLGHLTVAEPGALVGFLGPRVREILHSSPFPSGVQQSENLVRHGVLDGVLPLDGLRDFAIRTLGILSSEQRPIGRPAQPASAVAAVEAVEDAWESVQSTRLPNRPGVRELIRHTAEDFISLRGTGAGEHDLTVLAGLARFPGLSCVLVAHDRDPQQDRYLGPGGLRVAQRAFQLAEELRLPVVTVIDTPGADLSPESEESGMAGEIARCLATLTALRVPVVSVILGEGTGGGALALMPADRTVCAAHGWIAPLPPEGASAIVYRRADRAPEMARAHGIRASDLIQSGTVDEIVPEFPDASEEPEPFCRRVTAALCDQMRPLLKRSDEERLTARHERYRRMV